MGICGSKSEYESNRSEVEECIIPDFPHFEIKENNTVGEEKIKKNLKNSEDDVNEEEENEKQEIKIVFKEKEKENQDNSRKLHINIKTKSGETMTIFIDPNENDESDENEEFDGSIKECVLLSNLLTKAFGFIENVTITTPSQLDEFIKLNSSYSIINNQNEDVNIEDINIDFNSSKSITTYVKMMDGKTINISCDSNCKILELKKKLESKVAIPFNHQKLIYINEELDDNLDLSYYNIKNGSIIHILSDNEEKKYN